MARFAGKVGFGETVKVAPGVFEDRITEKQYYGDVVRNSPNFPEGEKVNRNLTIGNSISIVSDQHANEHIFAIRYVVWAGVRWVVENVDVLSPRLVLRLGEVYNGPTPGA